jgi:hypothetical protein
MEIATPQESSFPQPVSALIGALPAPPKDPTSALVVAYSQTLIGHTPSSFERIDAERRSLLDMRA